MSLRFKTLNAFILGGTASLLTVCAFLLLLWLRDVQKDRKHTVNVNTATPVFAGNGDEGGCHGTQLTTVERSSKLPVRPMPFSINDQYTSHNIDYLIIWLLY